MTAIETPILVPWPCPLGCPEGDDFVLEGRDRLHGLPGHFRVVRCRSCGLLRMNPRPTMEALRPYYPDDYGPHRHTVVAEASSDSRSALRRRLSLWLRHAIDSRSERLPNLPPGRLLEIGCASGGFLRRMAQQGWTVEGIEFSDSAARAAQRLGYRIFAGPIEEAPEPPESFDLVVGWMVLEHLFEPAAALEKLRSWTRPGGYLAISVPNSGTWEFRFFGANWYALQVPTHMILPSVSTLSRLLNKTGWRVERIIHQRDLRNVVASAGYLLEDRGLSGRLSGWLRGFPERRGLTSHLLFPLASILAAVGQTGRMTVWARRAS